MSDIPPAALVDPQTAHHLRTFWGEVGIDAMYTIGEPQTVDTLQVLANRTPGKDSCVTPIELFVRRSSMETAEYLSTMNLDVTFAEMRDIREGKYVSSPPPKHVPSEPPEVTAAFAAAREADKRLSDSAELPTADERELRFRFARLESVSSGADARGYFRKRLWVWGHVPPASDLLLHDELRLVIACTRLPSLGPLFLRPLPEPTTTAH